MPGFTESSPKQPVSQGKGIHNNRHQTASNSFDCFQSFTTTKEGMQIKTGLDKDVTIEHLLQLNFNQLSITELLSAIESGWKSKLRRSS